MTEQYPEVIETGRVTLRFAARSTGHNNGSGTWVIGPVLAEIAIVDYAMHRSSYYVSIDGRHQFGGFADHLTADGMPSGASFLEFGSLLERETLEVLSATEDRGSDPVSELLPQGLYGALCVHCRLPRSAHGTQEWCDSQVTRTAPGSTRFTTQEGQQ